MSKHTTPDIPRTIDLRPAANTAQGVAVLLMGGVGAVVGHHIATDHAWAGAAVGAFVGIVVATFFSGFAVMLTPPPTRFIDKGESVEKYKMLRRRLQCVAWVYVLLGVIAVAWTALFGSPSAWAIGLWLIGFVVCYGFLEYSARLLELWRCPGCGELFGRRGAFVRYPHVCANCNFVIDDN